MLPSSTPKPRAWRSPTCPTLTLSAPCSGSRTSSSQETSKPVVCCGRWRDSPLGLILRQNDAGVLADAYIAPKRHAIQRRAICIRVIRQPVGKVTAVAVPIAVEPNPPASRPRESNRVARIAGIGKIACYYHVVPRTALVPAMEGERFVRSIERVDINSLAAQSPGVVEPVTA